MSIFGWRGIIIDITKTRSTEISESRITTRKPPIMADLYANENFPLVAVRFLREMGHDVLTSLEAGTANQQIPDAQVLAFATKSGRAVLTNNRLHFKKTSSSSNRSRREPSFVLKIGISRRSRIGFIAQLARTNPVSYTH